MDVNLQVKVVNFAFTRLSTASTAGQSCRVKRKCEKTSHRGFWWEQSFMAARPGHLPP